jgi:lipoyl(octanoyl) transferase
MFIFEIQNLHSEIRNPQSEIEMAKQFIEFQHLGNISYRAAWDYQTLLQQELITNKLYHRFPDGKYPSDYPQKHYLLFCEHPPVYTLGKSGSIQHLLLNETELAEQSIDFFKINRGGDITFHGLGQIVGYPIFDLDLFFNDVHKYVRLLEEAVILTLKEYNINGIRIPKFTGVWLEPTVQQPTFRKICAIGVHISRWVTLHGFAFNINTDLNYFKNIVPCGIDDIDKSVTSLATELGFKVNYLEVQNKLKKHFADLFQFEYL